MYARAFFLYSAWCIAILGTLGSLYFGEGGGKTPCPLCWYQRICLFPLVFLLGVSVYKNFAMIWQFVIYQIVLGMGFALYQLLQSYLPGEQIFCGKNTSCLSQDAIYGIPFAFLSLLAFSGILLCLIAAQFGKSEEKL